MYELKNFAFSAKQFIVIESLAGLNGGKYTTKNLPWKM